MTENLYIPDCIRRFTGAGPYQADSIGCSGAAVLCFDHLVLKIEEDSEESAAEHRMLAWLQGKLPVPELVVSHLESGRRYLLMSRVEGEMACSDPSLADPKTLVSLLAGAFRLLWSVDAADCPRRNDLDNKLRQAQYLIDNNLVDMERVEPQTYGEGGFSGPQELLDYLTANRPAEEVCFSHGDFCLPNVFFQGGRVSGFIDLGRSGLADRWQDIALCVRSLQDNLQTAAYTPLLFEELGLPYDGELVQYYMLLDELF